MAEIIYGLVPSNVETESPGRRIIPGGCVVEAASPKWQCLNCRNAWGQALPDCDE